MKMKCDLKSVSVGLLAIVFFAAAFNPVFGVSADMKSSYTDLSSLDKSVVKFPFPLAVLSDTTNLIDKSIPHMKITNEKFGLLILDLSTYQEKTYQSKDLYTGFTIHGDITNGTTISMRSSHLLSLDKAIQNLGSSDFAGDPGTTKQTLNTELMNVNNLIKSDSLYGVWDGLTKINSTLPTLLTTSGQQKILPLFDGMLNSIMIDTAPTTPVATTEPQIQQPPLLLYIVMILLAVAIGIAISFPFRVSQVQKRLGSR